jgi:hypothetical protein
LKRDEFNEPESASSGAALVLGIFHHFLKSRKNIQKEKMLREALWVAISKVRWDFLGERFIYMAGSLGA